MTYTTDRQCAEALDQSDPLAGYRDRFHIPKQKNGKEFLYFTGNSLGLQPKSTRAFVEQELDDWARLGVEGHFHAKNPWMPYHEFVTQPMARVVGGKEEEVIVMNTLTVNLHLMMVSFYQVKGKRRKISPSSSSFLPLARSSSQPFLWPFPSFFSGRS